ncbi:hypothetical protein, partial [Xanthomonas phaseoli]|uniref:hypothetical protein n=1 Tax=Xanthomonas phaseoli TaxID=1985254 RepID=UPI001EE64477
LLEHGDDLAVGKAGLLHGTSSRKDTRKFHFWRLLMGGGITEALNNAPQIRDTTRLMLRSDPCN